MVDGISMRTETNHRRPVILRLLDWLLQIGLAAYILAGTPLVPFHGDESTLIYMARDYYYQFVERDWTQLRYTPDPSRLGEQAATEQHLRLLNGTLPKYLYGLAAHSAGYRIDDINDQWLWGAGWDYNQQNGHVPSDDLLLRARWVSAGLLAAGVFLIYALARAAGGHGAAWLASLYYALHPALLINGRRAMMEGGMVFFTLLVVLAGVMVLRHYRWYWYALLAIGSGLAVASKHTAAITVGIVFLACGSLPLLTAFSRRFRMPITRIQHVTALMVSGILALGIFFLLNPAWWGDPVQRATQVLELRTDLLRGQVELAGGYADFNAQLNGFARQVFVAQPMYAETEMDQFLENLADDIARYEASPWDGFAVGGSTIGGLILGAFSALGLLRMIFDGGVRGSTRWVIWWWGVTVALFTLLVTPLEWQRYYLPAYLVVGVFAASGVNWLPSVILRRRRNQPEPRDMSQEETQRMRAYPQAR